MLHQTVRIFLHPEEVRFFLGFLHRSAAVRAAAVDQLALGPERFARRAVHAFIRSLVDIPLLIQPAEDLLHLLLMPLIRGADEVVIAGVHHVERVLDGIGYAVDEFFRGNALFLCLFFDLLPMFIRAGLKEHIIALCAAVTGDRIRQHDLVSIADVRLARRVRDRRGDIVRFFVHENSSCPLAERVQLKKKKSLRQRAKASRYHLFSCMSCTSER